MKIVIPSIFSVVWKLALLILALLASASIYLYYYPLAVNVQIVPYGSFRIKYKLFSKHVSIDNVIINKQQIYIQPIAIPLTKAKIPRIYVGLEHGYIIIRNLNPLAIKESPIDIEVKDFCLCKIFPKFKNIKLTTNATLTLLDNKQFGLDVHNLSIINTPVGDVNAKMVYCRNDLDLKLELPKYNHALKCVGKFDINKPFKWDLKAVSSTIAKVSNLKINNAVYSGDVQYSVNWTHGCNNEKLQCKIISNNTHINTPFFKGLNLGKVCLNASYIDNCINSMLDISKIKHTVSCNGVVRGNTLDLNITPKDPIRIEQFRITDNLSVTGLLKYSIRLKRLGNKNIVDGYINASNSLLQSKGSVLLSNIGVNIKLHKDLLLLDKCEATISDFIRCKLQANGRLNINNLDTDIRIQVPNGVLHNVPIIKSSIKSDIFVRGNIKSPNIDGFITLINPAINATSTISGSMTSTDIVSNFMNKNKPKTLKWNEHILPVNVDIKVKIVPKITINGAGLKSSWSGGGSFIAKKDRPINWDLKLNIIDGQYEIVNKKVKLSSGEILFNSSLPNYYRITIMGQKKIDTKDIVGVKFVQYNDNTTIDFFSTTMRNRQDILSLFLFGKENAELSTSEAYSLGLLAQNLATGKDNIFNKMNKILKIDTFGIKHNTNDTENYNTVVVGKRIGKWNLSFEQGKNLDEASLSVERKIKKRTKIGISLSKKNGIEGGVSWNKRY